MKKLSLAFALTLISTACSAQDSQTAQATAAGIDEAAIFEAAGFTKESGTWGKCGDPGTPSYTPGAIEQIGDLNGDGEPEFLVTEGSGYCFGNTGGSFVLVSRAPDGKFVAMADEVGIASFLETKGTGGWPDLSIGGPGFCFPVLRWNGKAYADHRYEYAGKACQPPEF